VQLGLAAGLPDSAGVGEDFVAQALGGADRRDHAGDDEPEDAVS
jgi:hypothetical protein